MSTAHTLSPPYLIKGTTLAGLQGPCPIPKLHPQLHGKHLLWSPLPPCPTPKFSHRSSPIAFPITSPLSPPPTPEGIPWEPVSHASQGSRLASFRFPLPPPLLHPPTLIPSSVASHLLWPLLPLCPHSQGTKQILPAHPAILIG